MTKIADARVTATPNAVMTTLASPTQGDTDALSMWRVTMDAGQTGPVHTFDVEQVWHLLDGAATITLGDDDMHVLPGDTVVMAAGMLRRIATTLGAVFVVCGKSAGQATPMADDGEGRPVSPAWVV
jgi:quercetin dioxygenase-like cupin family protein